MPLSLNEEARLYAELLDLPAPEREARLAALDPDSSGQLRRLLSAPVDLEGELQSAIADEARLWSREARHEPGQIAGRFTIEERLGRGGSGEVYRVTFTQAGVPRQAALKLLHPNLLRSSQVALWDRERRLAAQLSHPFIATLLESGTLPTGEPYLLMEYVEGARIDEYCGRIPLRARVRTLIRVCEAVASAHRQLVIHRDLKPANILITHDGLPKLVDFGIAQALESQTAAIPAATKNYASPEQLSGADPTPASDIFSLGRVIAATLGEKIPEDLKSLIAKATQADPALRYPTADSLRDDLANWLNQRPVQAHSARAAYRLRCFLRRHRWSVAATSLLLVAAIAAGAVAWRQYREATTRFNELRSLARVAIFDIDTAIRDLPGALPARKILTETALGYLASLQAAAQNNPSLRADLADAYQRAGILQASSSGATFDRLEPSIDLLRKSLALRDELGQSATRDPVIRRDYAALLFRLTSFTRARMRGEESGIYLERMRAFTARWLKEEPSSREALEAAHSAGEEVTRRLRMQGVRPAYENQLRLLPNIERFRAYGPPYPRYWKLACDSYRLFGALAAEMPRPDEARDAFLRSVNAAESWQAAEPSIASLRTLLVTYTEAIYQFVHRSTAELPLLERYYQSMASLLDSPALPDPRSPIWRQHRIERLSLRGHIDSALGRPDAARQSLQLAIQHLDGIPKEESGNYWAAVLRMRVSQALARLENPAPQKK